MQPGKVQHANSATGEECKREKRQHEKMQHEKRVPQSTKTR